MNVLLYILLAILGLIALLLLIGLFAKKGYVIERTILINRSSQDVFSYIKLLKNQDYYSKWVMTDPTMKKVFKGIDGTPGFIYDWESTNKSVGKGEMEIKKITEGTLLETEIRFEKPFKGVSQVAMAIESKGGQTSVHWKFASEAKYPMNIMMLFVNFEKFLGKDMEISLASLKNILDK